MPIEAVLTADTRILPEGSTFCVARTRLHLSLSGTFGSAGARTQLFLNQAQLKPNRVDALSKAVPELGETELEAMQQCPYR